MPDVYPGGRASHAPPPPVESGPLRTKLFVVVTLLLLAVLGLSAYVAVTVGSELYEARAALAGPVSGLDRAELLTARRHLVTAGDKLDGVAASLLSVVPVAGHSVRAVEDVTAATVDVLDAADVLTRKLDAVASLDLIQNGSLRLDLVGQLRGGLAGQAAALETLVAAAEAGRSGWAPPPVWDVMDDLAQRGSEYLATAERGADVAGLMGPMLGQGGPRKYLVVLLNNAELRGAGGIPSAIGTVDVVEGRFTLGKFEHAVELRGPRPHQRVAAPSDFRRRFSQYGADTTFWTNTTFSPDVPDVALVGARAYEKVTGVAVDGVVLLDPRGIAALLPDGTEIPVPGSPTVVGPDDLADYSYSGVYAELGGATAERREALLRLGRRAFKAVVAGEALSGRATMEEAGGAVAGGHIRVVSFVPEEQAVLDALGAGGDLRGAPGDSLLVTAQNFSADKMDFWARRRILHTCSVADEGDSAACTTEVAIRNVAPRGLTRYVAGKPYGALEHLVEVYVPEAAEITGVGLDGATADFYPDRQDGHDVAGVFVKTEPGERHELIVRYDLPLDGRYSLEVLPQPLVRDPRLRVTIQAPGSWELRGEGERGAGALEFEGFLDRTMEFEAEPVDKPGLSGAWQALVRFWREPLF